MSLLKNISSSSAADQELIALYKQSGDLKTLGDLYQRYMELVFGVCLKYFKDTERCKDAVMDIFEELAVKLRQYEVDNFKGWLHVLARNHCLMQLRSPRNMKTTEFNAAFMQSEQNTHLNDEQLEKEENYSQLEKCMEVLQDEQKKCIELFYLKHKCYNEIVSITGYDWNKIRSYIQNGKRNLKICMEEKNSELKVRN